MNITEIQLADGIRQLYVPKLNDVTKFSPKGSRDWLAHSGNFVPIDGCQKDYFELTLYDINEFLACWAGDIVRMTCASIETVTKITESQENKKFLAWQMVQYYYSAFYAAHATLKVCGFGLIQLDKQIIRNVVGRAHTLGISRTDNITNGIYCVNIDVPASKIIFYRVNKYDDSHRGLWKRYVDFIDVLRGSAVISGQFDSNCIKSRAPSEAHPLSIYSQLPIADAQIVIDRIEAIRNTIDKRGDSNWLSWVRNLVNYNQAFGIWYPYTEYQPKYDGLLSMRNLYQNNPLCSMLKYDDEEVELSEFVKCCQIINAINYAVIMDLSKRNSKNKSFLLSGPLKFINLHKQ